MSRSRNGIKAFSALLLLSFAGTNLLGQDQVQYGPQVSPEVHHDTSAPLTQIGPAVRQKVRHEHPVHPLPRPHGPNSPNDPAAQTSAVSAFAPATGLNFDGVGNGFTGPSGTFTVNAAPPDTNGSAGPNHYVQIVNTDFAIFNKSGSVLYGPVPINTLWSGFGGGCETNDDGDPTVLYDKISDRWIITQFSVSTTPYLQCVAVSQTGDPTGAYNRYSFSYGNTDFPDYPKIAVWPDAYYITFNIFANGNTFTGAKVCAYDRNAMLAGQAATQQCFNTSSSYGGLLASDLDGATQPPAGSANYILSLGATLNTLAFWKFHVDWTTPANSSLTGPTTLSTAAFSEACNGGTCIPQSGTNQQLDSLADRLMYRLAYRNFGDHESLVANHSVTSGSGVGLRWYEIRSPATTPTIYQQGTYAPDSGYRWMGSIAMDQAGDMALGFSLSSSSLHPEIHYTGRLAGDTQGLMTQGEGTIINGSGSQTGSNLSRWGDYSSISVDPSDDCTFWYTNEYIPANGAFNWSTRIGSFKFSNCGAPANDFSIAASPATLSIQQGNSGSSSITTAVTAGTAGTVNLSASVSPAGPTASLTPTSATAGGSSTLTVNVGPTVAPGNYTVMVSGAEGSATHSTTVTVTVTAAPSDFSITANPSSLSFVQGGSATSTVSTAVTSGTGTAVSLTSSVSPAGTGVTASLNPSSVNAGASSTLTVSATSTATTGSYTITVTGTEASGATHSTSVAVTITAPPPADFSIGTSPANVSIAQGSSGTSTISTGQVGSPGTVSLAASVSPAGPTASLNPASVAAGGSSTLTISAGSSVATGTYTVTVTGTEGAATHTTSVTVTVMTAGAVVNGGFETGNLNGWTSTGTTAVVSGGHSGAYAARLSSTSPTNGDSTIAQTFTVPSPGGTLSFWYKMTCPDSVTYDWATATLKDNSSNTTTTLLPRTCATNSSWVQVSYNAAANAGHSVTLTLVSHDDNYPADPSYTLYDDVQLGAAPPPPPPLTNGGFETGNLTGWTSAGTASVASPGHTGNYAAVLGSTSPTNGDSSITQTFSIPSTATTLSFWYKISCPDTVTYDWATATLKDNTTNTTATLLARTCTNNGTWVQVTYSLSGKGGHSVTLTLISHDDNYPSDPTYTLYDDVVVQ